MLKIRELDEMNQLTDLLAKTLAVPVSHQMPNDVAVTLQAAKRQMEGLPEVIEDLNLAFKRYLTLNQTLNRMMALADESSRLTQEAQDNEYRQVLEQEFTKLAVVVAKEAGHRYFEGTRLTIADQASAQAANTVLSYLKPVLENLSHELRGQKALIIEAISETMNFMGIIAMCYPDAEGVDAIRDTLSRVKLPQTPDSPVHFIPTFH
ncbi:MAG: hypothetical protein LBT47_12130 [Deltaproteobacteria bacterium]|jgi:hypothetical protein|nr:hypothetical protein [Deltaproteobacteria bacterium]